MRSLISATLCLALLAVSSIAEAQNHRPYFRGVFQEGVSAPFPNGHPDLKKVTSTFTTAIGMGVPLYKTFGCYFEVGIGIPSGNPNVAPKALIALNLKLVSWLFLGVGGTYQFNPDYGHGASHSFGISLFEGFILSKEVAIVPIVGASKIAVPDGHWVGTVAIRLSLTIPN